MCFSLLSVPMPRVERTDMAAAVVVVWEMPGVIRVCVSQEQFNLFCEGQMLGSCVCAHHQQGSIWPR